MPGKLTCVPTSLKAPIVPLAKLEVVKNTPILLFVWCCFFTGFLVAAQGVKKRKKLINATTKYIVFRASRMRQIKAQLAAKGCSLGKSCNAEMAHS